MDANLLIASELDQAYAESVDIYDRLSPLERGIIADYLRGSSEKLRDASPLTLAQIQGFAAIAFIETAQRWANRENAS